MTLSDLLAACEATAVVAPDAQVSVSRAYTSDLLSDVMAHAPEESVLITIQNHLNTVAVATLVGCRAILICHGRAIPEEMAAAARSEQVAILTTPINQFEASNRIGSCLTTQGHARVHSVAV